VIRHLFDEYWWAIICGALAMIVVCWREMTSGFR